MTHMISTSERVRAAVSSQEKVAQMKHAVSLGVGYSFGSIFLDAAVRYRTSPKDYVIPYNYYYAPDPSQFYNKVVDDEIVTPELVVKNQFVDILLTLGWRF